MLSILGRPGKNIFKKTNFGTNKANLQDVLKFFALISMIIDHFSLFVLELSNQNYIDPIWLRLIGRFAMPSFCFYVGYNYFNKRKKLNLNISLFHKRYFLILMSGLLLEFLKRYLISDPSVHTPNILLSISISLIFFDLLLALRINLYFALIFLIGLSFITKDWFDYGTLSTAFIVLGYISSYNREAILYVIFTLSCCVSAFILNEIFFNFYDNSIYQYIILGFINFLIFILIQFNPLVKTNSRIFLISRYSLAIFIIHYSIFIILCWYLYFTPMSA